ncbi:MAG: ABC transporter permease [Desulfitobacteriia bacterium]|jgi:glycine betaine/proline transport system permease protein
MPKFVIPLEKTVNNAFDSIRPYIEPITDVISKGLETILKGAEGFLLKFPPWLVIIILSLLIFFLISKKIGTFALISFFFLYSLDLWTQTIETLAIVVAATIIGLIIAIPTGILASQNDLFEKILKPILDFMQTLPSFVYLIPAVIFFGLGEVAAVVATLIFSIPPAIRLTNLGIRQVPQDIVEAAKAFGSTKFQILTGVQLPLAMPTIMAGVNQCIMLGLSMSVIAAMIGAGGLGGEVLKAMQTINIGSGIEGGIGIVVIAILLDRITENISRKRNISIQKR